MIKVTDFQQFSKICQNSTYAYFVKTTFVFDKILPDIDSSRGIALGNGGFDFVTSKFNVETFFKIYRLFPFFLIEKYFFRKVNFRNFIKFIENCSWRASRLRCVSVPLGRKFGRRPQVCRKAEFEILQKKKLKIFGAFTPLPSGNFKIRLKIVFCAVHSILIF